MPGGFSFPPGSNVGAAGVVQLASINGTERVIVDNGGALLAETTTAAIAALGGATVSVLTYGAKGDGVTDDTAAIQAAVTSVYSNGGVVVFPAGTYLVSSQIILASNTTLRGSGTASTILGVARADWHDNGHTGNDPYVFFTNTGYGTANSNENIFVYDLQFNWVNNQFQDAHCVQLWGVTNAIVQNCVFYYGGDNVTGLVCNNFEVLGCASYESTGCPWDFFGANNNIRVISCYAESSLMQTQFCCFNASLGLQAPPGTPQVATGFKLIGCTFINTSASLGTINFDTLSTTCTINDVTISGNTFNNTPLVGRGDINGVTASDNRFYNIPTIPAFWCATDGTHVPNNVTFIDNQIFSPLTSLANSGVIRIWTNGYLIAGNTVTGGAGYAVACSTSTFAGIIIGNSFEAGTTGTIVGSAWSSVTFSQLFANGATLRWYDASGSLTSLSVQTDNNMVLRGTDGSGNSVLGYTWAQHATSSAFRFGPITEFGINSANFIRLTGGSSGAANANSPIVQPSANSTDANVALRVAGKGTPGALLQAASVTGPPTTTDIPAGYFTVAPDGGGGFKLYYNAAGSLKSVALA